jgi:hypothetical protein
MRIITTSKPFHLPVCVCVRLTAYLAAKYKTIYMIIKDIQPVSRVSLVSLSGIFKADWYRYPVSPVSLVSLGDWVSKERYEN